MAEQLAAEGPAADGGRPLRIALLSYRSKPHCGGQGVYVRALSRELVALGHAVEVLSGPPYPELDDDTDGRGPVLTTVPSLDLYRDPDPFRIPHVREFRSPVDVLEFLLMCTAAFPEPLTFSLRAWQRLRGRAGEFDVVHDNQTLGYGLLLLQRAGFPVVATVHHPITEDRRQDLAAAKGLRKQVSTRRWYSFLRMQTRVVRRLPALLTVSDNSFRDIVRDFAVPAERLTVVPVGVDTEVFRPPTTPRVPGRIVATASADVPIKGLVPLLEAVAKLRTERDVELVVVGRAKEGGAALAALDRLGLADAVRFASGVSETELVDLFGSAEVAVVPSLYEGFSLPAVETMACATPLVATTAGALPEVVGPDGVTALHVPPGDPEALAAAVGRLLDDPELAARIGAAGRARVVERFTWRAVAEQTVAWYRSVLPATTPAPSPPCRRAELLTVDLDHRFALEPGMRVLDMGCGGGRHAFALYRRGVDVVALDLDEAELKDVAGMFAAMREAGEAPEGATAQAVRGSAYDLPFEDASFDRIIAAEVLEHLPQDEKAMAELFRVLKPGGLIAVTVPRWGPELVCWALSNAYHEVEGGHVRIYRGDELRKRLTRTGLQTVDGHHTHALHAPYWWLKCAVGVDNAEHPLVKAYHRLLVWDMMKKPLLTRALERALDPVIGKSMVVYLRKPADAEMPRVAA